MINLSAFQEVVGRAIGFTLAFSSRFERFARNVLADQKLSTPKFDEKKAELKSQRPAVPGRGPGRSRICPRPQA